MYVYYIFLANYIYSSTNIYPDFENLPMFPQFAKILTIMNLNPDAFCQCANVFEKGLGTHLLPPCQLARRVAVVNVCTHVRIRARARVCVCVYVCVSIVFISETWLKSDTNNVTSLVMNYGLQIATQQKE